MEFEIRPCRDANELRDYSSVVQYVFAAEAEEVDRDVAATLPEWTTCAFAEDGRVVATMGTFPFTVRLNGAGVPMGGVTAVGTLPGFRRRGLLRRIMTEGLATMHERGQSFAILLASMGAIYQRFGYGAASRGVKYSFDPRFAAFESEEPPRGNVVLMPRDEAFPLLKQVFIEWATPRNLVIHRSPHLWEMSPFRPEKGKTVHSAVYRVGDTVRGYVLYTTDVQPRPEPGPNQVLKVRDFVPLDHDAQRALWNFLRGHDLVRRIEMDERVGEDDPTPELLLEPRMLNRSTSDQVWMRVVDVERGLAVRPYGSAGNLVIGIGSDPLCPWNEGSWELDAGRDGSSVKRTSRQPDLVMTINTLASLVAGYRGATHFLRAGLLEERTPGAAARADDIFRTDYAPFCPDGF